MLIVNAGILTQIMKYIYFYGKFAGKRSMVKTFESRIPPSPNLDKATVSFDKLNNTDLFLLIHGV